MLTRWLATGFDPARVTIVDPAQPVFAGVRTLATLPDDPPPDMLMLGIKPQALADVAPGLQAATSGALLLSILAGTRRATLHARFPAARAVVRVMPNLPVAQGLGAVALHGGDVADQGQVAALMAALGLVEWIDDEVLFDAVTALSGSGPAFLYRFIDALARGGVALGLPPDQAARLALQTVAGAAATAAASVDAPITLADRVASKGGSTRAGLDVLDEGGALDRLIGATLAAAARRNAELAALSAG